MIDLVEMRKELLDLYSGDIEAARKALSFILSGTERECEIISKPKYYLVYKDNTYVDLSRPNLSIKEDKEVFGIGVVVPGILSFAWSLEIENIRLSKSDNFQTIASCTIMPNEGLAYEVHDGWQETRKLNFLDPDMNTATLNELLSGTSYIPTMWELSWVMMFRYDPELLNSLKKYDLMSSSSFDERFFISSIASGNKTGMLTLIVDTDHLFSASSNFVNRDIYRTFSSELPLDSLADLILFRRFSI